MRPWQRERWRNFPLGTPALRYPGASGKVFRARLFGAGDFLQSRQSCSGTITTPQQTVPSYHGGRVWVGADIAPDVLRTPGTTITLTLEVFENGSWRTDAQAVITTGTNHLLTTKDGTPIQEPEPPGFWVQPTYGLGGVVIADYKNKPIRVTATFSSGIVCGIRTGGW